MDRHEVNAFAVSAALEAPEITGNEVTFYAMRGVRTFVNSEGATVVTPLQSAGVRVSADTQAADGMPLRDLFSEVARSPEGLPPAATLVARARELVTGLAALRAARQERQLHNFLAHRRPDAYPASRAQAFRGPADAAGHTIEELTARIEDVYDRVVGAPGDPSWTRLPTAERPTSGGRGVEPAERADCPYLAAPHLL